MLKQYQEREVQYLDLKNIILFKIYAHFLTSSSETTTKADKFPKKQQQLLPPSTLSQDTYI